MLDSYGVLAPRNYLMCLVQVEDMIVDSGLRVLLDDWSTIACERW